MRQQLATASELLMQSSIAASSRLDEVLREEKEQAALDRQSLLMQITNLVTSQGEAQDARLDSKIKEVQKDVLASKDSFESSQSQYNTGMDAWNEKETQLVEEVLRSREVLKGKLKEDWVVCLPNHRFYPDLLILYRLPISTTPAYRLRRILSMLKQSA